MKNPWIIVGVLAIVLFGGGILFGSQTNSGNDVVPTTIEPHIKGNPEAAVKLVEYSDFQCPACAAFQPVLNELLATFGDRLSIEFKHFPLNSPQAAVAAEAAGQQGKFFEFHDLLFARQQEWVPATIQTTYFAQYAEELGLDVEQFRDQLRDDGLLERVMIDRNGGIALKDAEGESLITGTPTFFLNGEKMEVETFEEFSIQILTAIDPALAPTSSAPTADVAPDVQFGI